MVLLLGTCPFIKIELQTIQYARLDIEVTPYILGLVLVPVE